MTLSTEVQARYPAQILKELTNPRAPGATSIDTTKLDQAITSVQRQFRVYVQAAYDSTLVEHVDIAVDGVVALLQKWGGASKGVARIRWDDWIEQCRALRDVGRRARIVPTSTSTLTQTAEVSGAKPPFDSSRWRDTQPGNDPGADTLE